MCVPVSTTVLSTMPTVTSTVSSGEPMSNNKSSLTSCGLQTKHQIVIHAPCCLMVWSNSSYLSYWYCCYIPLIPFAEYPYNPWLSFNWLNWQPAPFPGRLESSLVLSFALLSAPAFLGVCVFKMLLKSPAEMYKVEGISIKNGSLLKDVCSQCLTDSKSMTPVICHR